MTDKIASVGETEHAITADEFLAQEDIEFAKVPGLKPGDFHYLRSVTAGDVIEWTDSGEGDAKRTAGLRLIIKSLVDGIPNVTVLLNGQKATGALILNDTHIAALRKKSHKVTERLVREILKLNGMTVKGDTTEAEAQAKNA